VNRGGGGGVIGVARLQGPHTLHEFVFECVIPDSFPPSIMLPSGSVNYEIQAICSKAGIFTHQVPVVIVPRFTSALLDRYEFTPHVKERKNVR
jgi:hypothetical protein